MRPATRAALEVIVQPDTAGVMRALGWEGRFFSTGTALHWAGRKQEARRWRLRGLLVSLLAALLNVTRQRK